MGHLADKSYWHGSEVSDYDRKQRVLIPRKDELLETVVDFIPFERDEKISIVDVGSGPGTLSERALRRFPGAEVTLLDSSSEMLIAAEDRLRGDLHRVTFMLRDFNSPDWFEAIGTPDVIISSIALHFLENDRRPSFFREAHRALRTSGCFINAGAFLSTVPFIQRRFDRRKIEYRRQRLLEIEGRDVPFETLLKMDEAKSAEAGVNIYSFAEQTTLLEEAGFDAVEVVWRWLSLAVFVAYRGPLL